MNKLDKDNIRFALDIPLDSEDERNDSEDEFLTKTQPKLFNSDFENEHTPLHR